jgi:DNA-binding transcriptional LysR family regulator
VSSLEAQIGVVLFDRSGRYPKLTPEGVLLLADARNVVSGVDTLKARARLMSAGLEAELSVVVDVFFPTTVFSAAAKAFASRFPLTPLRVFVEGLGAAYQPVLDGRCGLGILAPMPLEFPTLVSESIGPMSLVTVAAADHPLAKFKRRIPKAALLQHVQLVLTDRSDLSAGQDYGVKSASTWRLADLSTKHAFLRDGVGWGNMPQHMVSRDLEDGTLVSLDVEDMVPKGFSLTMSAFHRASEPPGPAGRWLIDDLRVRYALAAQ